MTEEKKKTAVETLQERIEQLKVDVVRYQAKGSSFKQVVSHKQGMAEGIEEALKLLVPEIVKLGTKLFEASQELIKVKAPNLEVEVQKDFKN